MPLSPFKKDNMEVSEEPAARKSALRNGLYSAPPLKVARTLEGELASVADTVSESQGGSGSGVGGSAAGVSVGAGAAGGAGGSEVGGAGTGGGGAGAGASQNSGTMDASMSVLIAKMDALNTSFDSKFATLNQKLTDQSEEFKVELGVLRAEMVSE